MFYSEVFDVVIEELPNYKPGGDKPSCDVCMKKGKDIQHATMYCHTCSKKYCEKHGEVMTIAYCNNPIIDL